MVEVPEPPHHAHGNTGLPKFDLIMALSILFISVASLLTSLESERSMRALVEQNRRLVTAQSTPLLMLGTGNRDDSGKDVLSMTLSNLGTGPAQIVWFHIADAQGVSYSGDAVTERVLKLDPNAGVTDQQIGTTFMRSGDQRLIWQWPKPVANKIALAAWDQLNQTRFHLHASACYCSIFNECRITAFGDSRPKLVPSCDQSADHHS